MKDEGAPAENTEPQSDQKAEYIKAPRQVCDEEGRSYLSLVKKQSWKIALGVALCILSPVCMFILLGFSMWSAVATEIAISLGLVVLLVICALGVGIIVVGGTSLLKYDYLEKEEIIISESFKTQVQERRERENGNFTVAIAIGVGLCILSAVPLILTLMIEEDGSLHAALRLFSIALLFVIVSVGVFLFVKFGMIHGSYQKLLQEGGYTVRRKAGESAVEVFAGVYWALIVAVYISSSFLTGQWHVTWIIWPIAGAIFAVIKRILVASAGKRNRK